jgi:transcriptional regulator GlxA family with amidase domain
LASFSAHNGPALREAVGKLKLTDAIERRLLHDGRCLTLGNSAWLVGGSRLSHDRTFALPWFFAKLFADDFPQVQVARDSPVVTDGPFLSAAHSESMAELLIQLISTCYSTGFVQTVRAALQFDSSRQIAAAKAARDHLTRPTRDSVLALAVRWLDQNLDQPYNAEQLALACKVSHRTLHRHFQDVMQLTPLQYLNRLRCARACHLLETTIESILTIALACGYANLSGFSKMFTKEVGCPPRVYRSQRSLTAPRNRWKVELSSAEAP